VVHAAYNKSSAFFDDVGLCKEEQEESFFRVANAYGLVGLIQDQYLGVERQYLARVYAVANWTLVCCLCTEELLTSASKITQPRYFCSVITKQF